jgi:cell division septation protein DedD
LYRYGGQAIAKTGYAIQVASMSKKASVDRQVRLLESAGFQNVLIFQEEDAGKSQTSYKVLVGSFSNHADALRAQRSLKNNSLNGFIVDLKSLK